MIEYIEEGDARMQIEGYNLPDDLYYEPNHYWVRDEGDILVMGMDDFAQKLAGQVAYVQIPEVGKQLAAGKRLSKIESGKWLGKVLAPVSGELVDVNEELETNPGLINEDCYGKGWLFKIKPADKAELAGLVHGADAIREWILADIAKYVKK
jgi:glycine cleavage system H protein